jgi:hypothetical protein
MNWLTYYWRQSKGYRLCPWRSPYIRWRAETYWGGDMSALTARKFFRLMWRDRAVLRRFFAWADERKREQARLGEAAEGTTTGCSSSNLHSISR